MLDMKTLGAAALLGLLASVTPARAMTGVGCPDLPEYYRALGTVENGPGSCGMTMEEAQRIIAREQQGQAAVRPMQAPPRTSRRYHRKKSAPRS